MTETETTTGTTPETAAAPGTDAAADLHRAGSVLAAEAARYASFGWMRGTSGNLSVVVSRDPLRLAVTASGHDKGELTASDVVLVDGQGAAPVRAGRPPRPNCTPGWPG